MIQWINEVCEEYEIEKDEVSELKTLSGAGLMKLKRQDWKERSPKQGDLFFNLWTEMLQSTQKSEVHTTKSPPVSPRKGRMTFFAVYVISFYSLITANCKCDVIRSQVIILAATYTYN